MILQTAFFSLSLGLGLLVMGCRLLVVGSIVQSYQQPITNNQQPQKMLSNEVIAIFCIVFNGC